MTELQKILLAQAKNKNGFHTQDAIKLIYQNEFHAEHLIGSPEKVLQSLKEEIENNTLNTDFFSEDIGNETVRFHLTKCDEKAQQLIADFFMLSFENKVKSKESFLKKCNELIDLAKENNDFLPNEPVEKIISKYLQSGIRAIHHSDDFKNSNIVHYRIMNRKNAQMLLICLKALDLVNKNGHCVLAIDGKCGSGKTTVSSILQKELDCDVVHMDDFFLQSHQRTPLRNEMIGGNFDYERFTDEIIIPLSSRQLYSYRRFDCSKMELGETIELYNKPITIIEGSYSLHPILKNYYDISISLDIDSALQSQRILKRNGPKMHKQFIEKWIPKENQYFDTYHIIENAQFHL